MMNDIKVTKQMKRHAVIVAIKAQHNHTEIARFFKVARSFVAKVRKHLQAVNRHPALAAEPKIHAKGFNAIKTQKFVQKGIKEFVHQSPCKRLQGFRRHHQKSCAWRHPLQVVCDAERSENRLIRAKRLLNKLKHQEAGTLWFFSDGLLCWFFSDGKNFNLNQKVNPRNDRWLSRDPGGVLTVMHTKLPVTVMVLGVVGN